MQQEVDSITLQLEGNGHSRSVLLIVLSLRRSSISSPSSTRAACRLVGQGVGIEDFELGVDWLCPRFEGGDDLEAVIKIKAPSTLAKHQTVPISQ